MAEGPCLGESSSSSHCGADARFYCRQQCPYSDHVPVREGKAVYQRGYAVPQASEYLVTSTYKYLLYHVFQTVRRILP